MASRVIEPCMLAVEQKISHAPRRPAMAQVRTSIDAFVDPFPRDGQNCKIVCSFPDWPGRMEAGGEARGSAAPPTIHSLHSCFPLSPSVTGTVWASAEGAVRSLLPNGYARYVVVAPRAEVRVAYLSPLSSAAGSKARQARRVQAEVRGPAPGSPGWFIAVVVIVVVVVVAVAVVRAM